MERPWQRRPPRPRTWRTDSARYDQWRAKPQPDLSRRRYQTSILLPAMFSSRMMRQSAIAGLLLLLLAAAMQLPYDLGPQVKQRVTQVLQVDTDIAAVAATVQQLAAEGRDLSLADFRLDPALMPVLRPREQPAPESVLLMDAWQWPVDGDIQTPFGWVVEPSSGQTRFHDGLLFRLNDPDIRVTADGIVSQITADGTSGYVLVIQHDQGWVSRYSVLADINVTEGQHVRAGETIGRVASRDGTAATLYFTLMRDGNYVDPEAKLRG